MNIPDLISVHVPKCAGSSLRESLLDYYGQDHLYLDYDDRPLDLENEMHLNPELFYSRAYQINRKNLSKIRAIHGHFNIRKYEHLRDTLRVTVLRNPIDRLISHFHYWRNKPFSGEGRLRSAVYNGDLDLLAFSDVSQIKYIYSGVFFWGVDMKSFDFIGRFENNPEIFSTLKNKFHLDLKINFKNKNRSMDYSHLLEEYYTDTKLMNKIKNNLKLDISFYEKWLS